MPLQFGDAEIVEVAGRCGRIDEVPCGMFLQLGNDETGKITTTHIGKGLAMTT